VISLNPARFLAERDWQTLRMLVPFFYEYRYRILLALVLLLLVTAATLTVPFLLKHIVDGLDPGKTQIVVLPMGLLAAYALVRFSSMAVRELTLAIYGTVTVRAMRRVSLKVLQHLHSLDLEYHLSRRTGAISRDMDRGVSAIAALLRILTFQVLNMFLGVGGVTVVLLANYSWSYALIILVAVVFYGTYTVKVTEWRTPFIRESNDANSRANTRAVDSLINYETVKYFGNEPLEAEAYDRDLEIWESARRRNRYSLAGLNAGQSFFIHCGMLGMMALAAVQVMDGELTLGDLVAINAFAVQVFVPLNQLGGIYRELKRCFTDVERMFDILNTPATITSPEHAEAFPDGAGTVEFQHVCFGYQAERQILKDVSFTVEPGAKVAIVGPSGAGKSTIARLLFRFYDIQQGDISINGKPINLLDLDALREHIGVVPQDATLFNASLRENITYGNPRATQEQVSQAIDMAQLTELLERLPDKLDTVVGERGLKLSGGEKQRVAIARAILKQPRILVFDEATSSLDSASEKAIMAAINQVSKGHTSILIAHRLSTIMDADSILVLENGEIIEQGNHQSLMAADGLYRELWDLQLQEALVDADLEERAYEHSVYHC